MVKCGSNTIRSGQLKRPTSYFVGGASLTRLGLARGSVSPTWAPAGSVKKQKCNKMARPSTLWTVPNAGKVGFTDSKALVSLFSTTGTRPSLDPLRTL